MTPEQALAYLDEVASKWNTSREHHVLLQKAAVVLAQFITASKPVAASAPAAQPEQRT